MITIKRIPQRLHLSDPAMPAPPGMRSNFVNPNDLKTEGLILVIFCLTISTFVVSMRMWTKIRLLRKVVLEDWISCLALVTFTTMCALIFVALDHGSGVHRWNIRVKNILASLPYGQVGRILYCIDMFLIKLAILLQLLRVFVPLGQRNAMFWTCHALIWLNFVYYTAYVFLAIFYCNPIKKGWSQQVYPPTKGSCLNLREAYIAGATINTASDLSIVILPQPVIWHLQLSLKRKIGLCLIFLIGLFACASSIVRLYYSIVSVHYEDFTYLAGLQDLWAVAETTCGISAMCLPISPKFFRSIQNSNFWSGLKISLHSFTRSKLQFTQISNIRSDEAEPTKQSNSSHSFKALFREYNVSSQHDIELQSTLSNASGERTNRHDLELNSTRSDARGERTKQRNH